MRNLHSHIAIIISVAIATLLSVLPLPNWAVIFWPTWPLLVITYWILAYPNRYGIKTAWLIGIVMDLTKHTLLGQHALTYAITAYAVIHFYPRFRIHSLLQQSCSISILLFPYFFLNFWIEGILYHDSVSWQQWAPLITNILVWPWVFSTLRIFR